MRFGFGVGQRTVLHFCPRLYLSDLTEDLVARFPDMDLPGEVVGRRSLDGAGHFYHVRFLSLPPDRSAALQQFVHRISVAFVRRRFRRVRVGEPIEVRLPDESERERRTATLVDLGAGGACVESPRRLPGAEQLVLYIQPRRYVSAREGRRKMVPGDVTVTGTIVGIRNGPNGRVLYHVDFRDMGPLEERHLVRIVTRIQEAGPE